LMVSASSVQGQGTSGDLAGVQLRLFQNAEKTVKNAAADPELQITRPFHKHLVPSALEPWSLHAQTHEGDTLFYQAVCCDPRGVLLVTLEAPNTQQSQTIFERFINSIKPASAGGHVN